MLLPAAAMFEAAAAAAHTLLDWSGGSSTAAPLLAGLTIPAPLQLASSSRGAALPVTCRVAAGGGVQLVAGSTAHLAGSIALCPPAAVERQTSATWPASLLVVPQFQAASRPHPVVVARLAAHGGSSGTAAEYWAHPAALDATIHAGTALNPTRLSVPTSLAAFAVPSQLASNAAWAAAGNLLAATDGSATGDFTASLGTSSNGAARLQQLHSQPVASRAGATPAARLLYQVQWRAAEPAEVDNLEQPSLPPRGAAHKLAWHTGLRGQAGGSWLQPAVGTAAELVSGAIAWRQARTAHTSGQQASRIGLHAAAPMADGLPTICCGSSGSSSGAAVGLAGLLRSVAREQAGQPFYSLLASSYSPVPPALHQPGQHADAYGAATAGSALMLPRLSALADAPPGQQQAEHGMAAGTGMARLAGRVLVSGGLGDLGLLTAAWLVQATSTHAVLLGRTAHSRQMPAALLASGSPVSTAMADVASREDVAALAALNDSTMQQLCGVIHAGGTLADASLARQTAHNVRTVLAPKVNGGQLLMSLAAPAPVCLSVLFSSTAALVGPAGQANYAAANALLGGLAAAAQQSGHSSLSVLWGAWSVGMAGRDAALAARIQRSGMGLIAPAQGLQALAHLVTRQARIRVPLSSAVATPFDWARLQQAASGAVPAMFEDFGSKTGSGGAHLVASSGRQPAAAETAVPASVSSFPARMPSVADVARHVSQLVQASLGSEVGTIAVNWMRRSCSEGSSTLPRFHAPSLARRCPPMHRSCLPVSIRWQPWSCATACSPASGWNCRPLWSSTTPRFSSLQLTLLACWPNSSSSSRSSSKSAKRHRLAGTQRPSCLQAQAVPTPLAPWCLSCRAWQPACWALRWRRISH